MSREIFLNENKSYASQSEEYSIDLSLATKMRSLPYNELMGELSAYQLYNAERDASTKFRMIFTVNPVCTNVLFNMKTEIMKDEGSSDCKVLTDKSSGGIEKTGEEGNSTELNRIQAVRDTEYNHEKVGGLTYHCGLDIFNNHMLRNNQFSHVNKTKNDEKTDEYNTIKDYLRDSEGNRVEEKVGVKYNDTEATEIHLYQHDTILDFYDAFYNRLEEQNGWYGFTNPGNVEIPNSNGLYINRLLSNNRACEFIDMYPDRSLYSFVPKYNEFRNRVEKNWDYKLTYSYDADKDKVNNINNNGGTNAIRCFWERVVDKNGNDTLRIRTLFKHTLAKNDKVRLYYKEGGEAKRFSSAIRVVSIGKADGTDKDKVFSIDYSTVAAYGELFKDGLWYRKEYNGVECEYYFQKLKEITKEDGESLRNDILKAGFAENIYGDPIAQVIYTDNIDIDGLKDNLGRMINKVYFTVVKRNKGNKLWYDDNDFTNEEVEYSHCFGDVTVGLDMGTIADYSISDDEMLSGGTKDEIEETVRNYNVRYLHNVPKGLTGVKTYWGDNIEKKPLTINDEDKPITIDDDFFWGDVIEFDVSDFKEIVIEKTMYRFNTMQRESSNAEYQNIQYDEMKYDDYDFDGDAKAKFEINGWDTPWYLNAEKGNETTPVVAGNINPEGYFYHPNMAITVRDLSDSYMVDCITMSMADAVVEHKMYDGEPYSEIKVKNLAIDYKFIYDDVIGFYDSENKETLWGSVTKVDIDGNPTILLKTPKVDEKTLTMVLTTDSVPAYARYIPRLGKLTWRTVIAPSALTSDSEIYDLPFANGCFYIEKGFNIFVRRQDPNGKYGMLWGEGKKKHPMKKYALQGGDAIDLSAIRYVLDKFGNVCF